jgi:competence ComEA-like helix-hairpin-helix protein
MADPDEISTAEAKVPTQESAGGETDSARNSETAVPVNQKRTEEVAGTGDRSSVLLLAYSCFFFVLLSCQYAWFYFDKPAPLVWRRGEKFQSFRVDVNHATWVDWIQLPGIGQTTAEQILSDLDRNGPFKSIDDLMRVKGIGPKTLDQIRPWLTIRHDHLESTRNATGDDSAGRQSSDPQ